MAAKTTLAAWVLVSFLDFVVGYYCDSDKCSDDEYCCGYNLCCTSYKVWDLWYFWCGLLFFVFLLTMCGCFWRNGSRTVFVFSGAYNYSPLNQQSAYVQTNAKDPTSVMSHNQFSRDQFEDLPPYHPPAPSGSPPPDYCHIVTQADRYTK